MYLLQDYAVKMWLDGGAPKEKLIMGFPTYGRSFTLSNTMDTGLGAPSIGRGTAGPYNRESSVLAYYEVRFCMQLYQKLP